MLEETLRGNSIFFYDSDCGFCSSAVQFVIKRDKNEQYFFAPLQGKFAREALAQYRKDPLALNTSYVLTNYGTEHQQLLEKSRAGIAVLRGLGGLWKATGALYLMPLRIADKAYDLIASHRHALVKEACLLPDAVQRTRFIME
jgi:predicted DCC family thiol-disulfide oxidoreductase YuxK